MVPYKWGVAGGGGSAAVGVAVLVGGRGGCTRGASAGRPAAPWPGTLSCTCTLLRRARCTRALLPLGGGQLLSGGADRTIRYWDAAWAERSYAVAGPLWPGPIADPATSALHTPAAARRYHSHSVGGVPVVDEIAARPEATGQVGGPAGTHLCVLLRKRHGAWGVHGRAAGRAVRRSTCPPCHIPPTLACRSAWTQCRTSPAACARRTRAMRTASRRCSRPTACMAACCSAQGATAWSRPGSRPGPEPCLDVYRSVTQRKAPMAVHALRAAACCATVLRRHTQEVSH